MLLQSCDDEVIKSFKSHQIPQRAKRSPEAASGSAE